MAHVVTMPAVLAGAEEATLLEWKVAEGEAVEEGAALAEVETDKATVEVPASASGTVGRLLAEPGTAIAVGAPLAALLAEGEDAEDLEEELAATASPEEPASPGPAAEADAPAGRPVVSGGAMPGTAGSRLFASPLARRLARERGLDLAAIEGTGPNGRITRRDVERASVGEGAPGASCTDRPGTATDGTRPEPEPVPHSRMRRAIARRLTEAKATVPHFYLRARCRVDALLRIRAEVNAVDGVRVSVNDLVVRAMAVALREVPEANVRWSEEGTLRLRTHDVGVAVSTEEGLLVPVVRDVLDRPMGAVARETRDLVERARAGRLSQQELDGGSMTVSNLGMHGVEEFAAIINPPQCAILAVGAAESQAVVESGDLVVATVMTVTLSVDHRVLDGEVAARWLAAFVRAVEHPVSLLV